MPIRRLFGTIHIALITLLVSALSAPNNALASEPMEASYLIVFHSEDLPAGLQAQVEEAGGLLTATIPQIGVAVAASHDSDFVENASNIPGVWSVTEDVVMEIPIEQTVYETEVVPDFSILQWGLDAIHAPEVWDLGITGHGARVVVIDTGILVNHPDLAPNLNLDLSTSFVPGETVEFIPGGPGGNSSHATTVAGVIVAADNGFGTIGVAPDAELVAVKMMSDALPCPCEGEDCHPNCRASHPSWLLQSIVYAADIGADVLNASVEGNFNRREVDNVTVTALTRAANYAHAHGTTLIGVAGNFAWDLDHDEDALTVPRDLPHFIPVSATGPIGWAIDPETDLDVPSFYTNYGRSVIELAAPGGNNPLDLTNWCLVYGLFAPCAIFDWVIHPSSCSGPYCANYEPNGFWSQSIGTSLAGPHVAGVVALMIDANGGSMHPDQVRAILTQTADDLGQTGRDPYYGRGRVNALRAVQAVR